MVGRSLVGAYTDGSERFRTSKPTREVMSALIPEYLGFDSTWSDGWVFYKQGMVVVPREGSATFPFGETLPTVPFLIPWWTRSATEFRVGNSNVEKASDPFGANYFAWTNRMTLSSITFYAQQDHENNGYGQGYTARFILVRGPTVG